MATKKKVERRKAPRTKTERRKAPRKKKALDSIKTMTVTNPKPVPVSEAYKPTKEELKACLVRAKELLQKGWTQRAMARDAKGDYAETTSRTAKQFCAAGALDRASLDTQKTKERTEKVNAIRYAATLLLEKSIPGKNKYLIPFNDADGRKKADVMSLFAKVIEKA